MIQGILSYYLITLRCVNTFISLLYIGIWFFLNDYIYLIPVLYLTLYNYH